MQNIASSNRISQANYAKRIYNSDRVTKPQAPIKADDIISGVGALKS